MRLWISKDAILDSQAIKTASAEELRILLSVLALEGENISAEKLSKKTGIIRSRVAAAISLFSEEGILSECCPVTDTPTITEEFEERLRRGELLDEGSLNTAKTIRDEGLASLIEECAKFMKRDSLSSEETKQITSLVKQYDISPEFLLLLTAHMSSTLTRLTPLMLRDKTLDLFKKEITTVEELERYIETVAAECDVHREFRRVMGLYGGALSPTQKKYFNRWGLEFGFGTAIVTEAYDRAALNANGSMRYMDKILTEWHEAGCKTVSECIAHTAAHKNEKASTAEKKQRGKKAEPVRYGDFDVNDAFERALLRSYGNDTSKDGKEES